MASITSKSGDDQLTLYLYFLGKASAGAEPDEKVPASTRYLRLEGGDCGSPASRSATSIRLSIADPKQDDCLVVRVDRVGDFSPIRCAWSASRTSILDTTRPVQLQRRLPVRSRLRAAVQVRASAVIDEPEINYLAKDYESFRQLILDRLVRPHAGVEGDATCLTLASRWSNCWRTSVTI